MRDLTFQELTKVRDIILKKTGMFFDDRKSYFLNSKIKQIIESLGISPEEYIAKMMYNHCEVQRLIDTLTIGETKFFREIAQIQTFFDIVLKNYLTSNNLDNLKIMSAGCATGEEAYTLAILSKDKFPLVKTQIIGIDINTTFIKKAIEGEYHTDYVKDTPIEYLSKYLEYDREKGMWNVAPSIKSMVQFKIGNIKDPIFMRAEKDYDAILCKNVLIYFEEKARRDVLESMWFSLKKGGSLMLGTAERVGSTTISFELEVHNNFLFYKKVKNYA